MTGAVGEQRPRMATMGDDLIDREAAIAVANAETWEYPQDDADAGNNYAVSRIVEGLRALPSATQAGGWMPIDSAPKDGPILLYGITAPEERMVRYKSRVVFSGYWSHPDENWCAHGSHWDGPFFDVTHWKPLDDPPTAFTPLPPAPEGEAQREEARKG